MTIDRTVVVGGRLQGGGAADIAIDRSTGLIDAVGDVTLRPTDHVIDCSGSVVLPAGAEPHAHLDKALFCRGRQAQMAPSLGAAIDAWLDGARTMTHADVVARAEASIEMMIGHGTTAVRTHVDVWSAVGMVSVRALVEVREHLRSTQRADLEIVALIGAPLSGDAGRANRRLLDEAIDLGVDIIGGAPHLDDDPVASMAVSVRAAQRVGLRLDLHMDESVDAAMFTLRDLARQVGDAEIVGATASHCASLSMQPLDVQEATATELAAAGISVTVMPVASLFFFGHDISTAPPRGLAPVRVLREAGVVVAAGGDNVQDPFLPLGRFDPFQTAAVLGMVAHLDPADAWQMCSERARTLMGLPSCRIAPGSPANLIAIRGRNLVEAVANADEARTVIHHGRVVARATVERAAC